MRHYEFTSSRRTRRVLEDGPRARIAIPLRTGVIATSSVLVVSWELYPAELKKIADVLCKSIMHVVLTFITIFAVFDWQSSVIQKLSRQ